MITNKESPVILIDSVIKLPKMVVRGRVSSNSNTRFQDVLQMIAWVPPTRGNLAWAP